MEKATVIFKNEDESKSLKLDVIYNSDTNSFDVKLSAEPKEKIKDVFARNDFYASLTAKFIDELGEIEQ